MALVISGRSRSRSLAVGSALAVGPAPVISGAIVVGPAPGADLCSAHERLARWCAQVDEALDEFTALAKEIAQRIK